MSHPSLKVVLDKDRGKNPETEEGEERRRRGL